MLKLLGIKNCDTTKKAIKYLNSYKVDYTFIDIKTIELSDQQLSLWMNYEQQIINKRSTTYRQIKVNWEKANNLEDKLTIIKANPTLLKRPILGEENNQYIEIICIGYDENKYKKYR